MKNSKKLLYIVRYPLYERFSLQQKFDGQLNAFKELGYHVMYIGFDKRYFYLIDGENKQLLGKTRFYIPNYFHTFLYIDLYRMAMKVVKEYGAEIAYYRSAPAFRKTYSLAKFLAKNNCKFIFEIPTYTPNVQEEDLSFARKLFRGYSNIWSKKIEHMPDLYVFMGDGNFTTFKGCKAIRIENGIAPELMPKRNPRNNKNRVNILALSSMSYWHGYDRLINSLAQYKGDKDVVIHIVGPDDGGSLSLWQETVSKNSLEDKGIFHGPKYKEELDRMFDLCDIGVNSMAMFRKGFEDTSELKTREYVARGLPFVSSVYDVILDELDSDLYIKISNDETIPSMEDIVEFALQVKNDVTVSERLRNYAIKTMTWTAQYKKVFERLEGVE